MMMLECLLFPHTTATAFAMMIILHFRAEYRRGEHYLLAALLMRQDCALLDIG